MATLQLQHLDAAAGDVLDPGGPLVAYDVADGGRHLRGRRQAHASSAPVSCSCGRWSTGRADGAVLAAEVDLNGEDRTWCGATASSSLPTAWPSCTRTRGPGIRCLVEGQFAVETQGTRHEIDRLGAWFEAGPDPVYAEVRGNAAGRVRAGHDPAAPSARHAARSPTSATRTATVRRASGTRSTSTSRSREAQRRTAPRRPADRARRRHRVRRARRELHRAAGRHLRAPRPHAPDHRAATRAARPTWRRRTAS